MEDELVCGCDARLSGSFCGKGSVMVKGGLMIVSWLERRVFRVVRKNGGGVKGFRRWCAREECLVVKIWW